MSEQRLVMAAGLADRHQPFNERNKLLVRNTSVYWCDYRDSCRKVGAYNLGMLASLLYEGIGLSIRTDFISD